MRRISRAFAFLMIVTNASPAFSAPDSLQAYGEDCEVIMEEVIRSRVKLEENNLAKQAVFSCQEMPNSQSVQSAIGAAEHSTAGAQWELMKSLAIRTLVFVQIQRHGSSFETMNTHSPSMITSNSMTSGEAAFQKASKINGVPGLSFKDFMHRLLKTEGRSGIRNVPYTEMQAYLVLTRLLFETTF